MKITIINPDLSSNCLGRSYFLAKVLKRKYEVEIVGPFFGDGIWPPVSGDSTVEYKAVDCRAYLSPLIRIRQILGAISGDVIYVSKPLLTSLGIALLYRRRRKVPFVIDIEDWQLGFYKELLKTYPLYKKIAYMLYSIIFFYRTNSYFNSWIMERFIDWAEAVTVSNSFLKKKYGGEVIVHARDTDRFDPEKFQREDVRREKGIALGKKVVMFLGTPRTYKGLEDLARAVSMIEDPEVMLLVVGISKDWYSHKFDDFALRLLGRQGYIGLPMQPFEEIPEFLAAADVVAIPQRMNLATVGQIPAKVFDAMAMAKPIVSTDVSDMKEILKGCGWVVKPGDPGAIAEAIEEIFADPEKAQRMGEEARKRCIEKYSWDATGGIMQKVFGKYEEGNAA
ncbi:MAG: glycosyltransferase [Candidatus Omnitrophica bacterium]|nr:glycosyltransferase [Candidatus Omnitrophota bacterium]